MKNKGIYTMCKIKKYSDTHVICKTETRCCYKIPQPPFFEMVLCRKEDYEDISDYLKDYQPPKKNIIERLRGVYERTNRA
jgi:hypothetical protein